MNFEISSPTIGLITEALSKAQGSIGNAIKDSKNPFFKSNYADLSSVMAVTKEPLSSNGLSFTSSIVQDAGTNFLVCTLSHTSGEWFRSYMPLLIGKNDMQALGAGISYGRRFCLAAMCHVGTSDDDGEGTIDRTHTERAGVDKVTGEVKKALEDPIPFIGLDDKQKMQIMCLVEAIDDKKWIEEILAKKKLKSFTDISLKDFKTCLEFLEKKVTG